jgi:Winged helix DNA-binding domain
MTLDRMVLRYLGAFGPASVMDAQAWSGLTKLREVFERLRPDLAVLRDEDGRELFDLPDGPRPDPDTPAPPRFLYDFENLLLSYADRTRTIPPGTDVWSRARDNEPVSTFLIDGVVRGAWKIERERGRARLVLRIPAAIAPRELADLTDEGRRLLAFAAADASDRDITVMTG